MGAERIEWLGVCEGCGIPKVITQRDGHFRPLSGGDECGCGSEEFSPIEGDDIGIE